MSSTLPFSIMSQKLGQPVPDSNLVAESNKGCPQAAQVYTPCSFAWTYSPVKGRSVTFCRKTAYCSGVSSLRHSASLLRTFSVIALTPHVHRLSSARIAPNHYATMTRMIQMTPIILQITIRRLNHRGCARLDYATRGL